VAPVGDRDWVDRSTRTTARAIPLSTGLATLVLALVLSLAAAGDAAAQNRPEIMTPWPEVSGYIRMGGILFENFFQLPDNLPRQDLWAGMLELRVEDHLGHDGGFRAYIRADLLEFQHRGLSPGLLGGFRRVEGLHRFDASLSAQWNRPRFDTGDTPQQANILVGNASYSLVVSSLEVAAMAEYLGESPKLRTAQDSVSRDAGVAIRYSAFRRRISAEVGVMQGTREAGDLAQGYTQETRWVAVRTSAVPRVYLSGRYRTRVRDYTIEDARSRNFGRQDQRRQLTGYVDIALWGNLVWNLSGGVEEAESTRKTSAFRSKQFATTVSVMLAGR
jgi:hypothetical protein